MSAWMHPRQHWKQLMMYATTRFLAFFFVCSSIKLTNATMATMRVPKAIEPSDRVSARTNDATDGENSASAFGPRLKYQPAMPPATVYWNTPEMTPMIQKNAKTLK
eukprot:Amastigsp_a339616_2070.p4 type:complete len:106 gc:universal Amastigsp_a339616_2070:518-835(+)